MDQEVNSPISPKSTLIAGDIKKECKTDSTDSVLEKNLKENHVDLKKEFYKDVNSHDKIDTPIVGETIEESVMIVKGEGSGKECDTGNPDETNTQNEASKNEDVKKPKLWSIETICSSSKEVREEISVPKTGFFFGDDSVPCFNNVSNGENSVIKDEKLIVDPLKKNEELKIENKKNEIDSTTLSYSDESLKKECSSTNEDNLSSNNVSKQSVFNIKVHEEEVQITERKANEVFTKSNSNVNEDTHQTSVDIHCLPQEPHLLQTSQVVDSNDANESHTSDITAKCDDTDHNVSNNIYKNKIIDKHKIISDSEKVDSKNIEDQKSTECASSHINESKQTVEQEKLSLKSDGSSKGENEKQSKNDLQIPSKITDPNSDALVLDSKVETDKQSINEINQYNEIENVSTSFEKVVNKESPTNIVKECVDINEQKSIDMVEQKSCESDKKNVITDNQMFLNESSIIYNKEEALAHLISKNNETDKELTENIYNPIQSTDDSITNATSTNDDLSQHTSNEYLTTNTIDLSSKMHDQTKTDTIIPCIKTSKLIDDDHINKKPANTSYNISNIINTEATVSSDSVKAQEQSTNFDTNKNKQLDISHIIDKNNLEKNIILEEKKVIMNVDSPVVTNNKHSLDNILKKSDKMKDVIELSNWEKKTSNEIEISDKPVPSSFKYDLQTMVKPEINIEKFETKCMDISNDLTVVREECNLTENNKNIAHVVSKVQEKEIVEAVDEIQSVKEKKTVDTIDEVPIIQEKETVEKTHNISSIQEKKINQIPSVPEKKIVEISNKIPSLQKKITVGTFEKISSIQEKKIVETINEIPSTEETKIVVKIDEIPGSLEKKIVDTVEKIQSIEVKETFDTIDKIPSSSEKEMFEMENKISSIEEKEIVDTVNKIPSLQEKEIVDTVDKMSTVVKNDEYSVITTEQCSKDTIKEENYMETNPKTEEIKPNEKSNLRNADKKSDSIYEEKSGSEEDEVKIASDNDENLVHNKSKTMEVSKDSYEEIADKALQYGKIEI